MKNSSAKKPPAPLKYVTRDRLATVAAIEQQALEASLAEEKPSKSEQKRRMHKAQALGEVLISLPASVFRDLPVEEFLRDALVEAQRLKSHEAIRRQRQLIGKLMREVDCEPIEQYLRSRHVTLPTNKL
jgi:ribosome-associated protein